MDMEDEPNDFVMNKSYLIDRVLDGQIGYYVLGIVTLFYAFLIVLTLRNMNKPHIQCRSPVLILFIFLGSYLDTMFKLLVRMLSIEYIDWKCQLSLFTRHVFHNMILVFSFLRVFRVFMVDKIQRDQLEGRDFKKTQYLARLYREERVYTFALVNIIAPFVILSLVSFFSPYFMIVAPIEEQDVCWLYYLSRSPNSLDQIDTWLYKAPRYYTSLVTAAELILLSMSGYVIR